MLTGARWPSTSRWYPEAFRHACGTCYHITRIDTPAAMTPTNTGTTMRESCRLPITATILILKARLERPAARMSSHPCSGKMRPLFIMLASESVIASMSVSPLRIETVLVPFERLLDRDSNFHLWRRSTRSEPNRLSPPLELKYMSGQAGKLHWSATDAVSMARY